MTRAEGGKRGSDTRALRAPGGGPLTGVPGWHASLDERFAGALVRGGRYRREARAGAVMVELNGRLDLREVDSAPSADCEDVAGRIRQCCVEAVASYGP